MFLKVETVIAPPLVTTSFLAAYDRNLSWKDEILLWRWSDVESIAHYAEAFSINPSDNAVRYNLATAYKKSGLVVDAVREFENIHESDPNDQGAQWNLMTLKGAL